MINSVFIQMSGAPGAGKTTIAHAVARHIGAVVIDHDIAKSALLEANISDSAAGHASYLVLHAMARHLLQQGFSLIVDSPCYYEELLDRGQQLAKTMGVAYRYIECVVTDLDELDRRLNARPRLRSQVAGVYAPLTESSGMVRSGDEVFREWIANMKRPQGPYLVLDTSRALDVCVPEALAYIETGQATEKRRVGGHGEIT